MFLILDLILIIALVGRLIWAPNGKWFWGEARKGLDGSNIDSLIEAQKNAEIEVVDRLPKTKDFDEQAYFLNKIQTAIQYAIGRHDWYEQQRSTIYQMTLAGASFMFVICGMALGATDAVLFHFGYFAVFTVAIAVISVVAALWRYNSELDADRPYRSVSDIRFWYFRYNFPDHSSQSKADTNIEIATAELEQRKRFFNKIDGYATLNASVREDLEQLFILQILQRYKSESLTRLRWTLAYMIGAFCLHIILSLGVAFSR